MNLDGDFTEVIGKLHTTKMGEQRIKRNLGIQNVYIQIPGIEFTVNTTSFTIITAHKL